MTPVTAREWKKVQTDGVSSVIQIAPQVRIDRLVADMPIAADVLRRFGLHCAGCGISKYETLEQGVNAHGLRIEPVLVALEQALGSGVVPEIAAEDLIPLRRAPGAFERRGRIGHVIPIMSGKGGVGKSLTTSMLAVALRRRNLRVGVLDADITGPSIPRFFGLRQTVRIEKDPNAAPPAPGRQPKILIEPLVTRTAIQVISSNLLTNQEDKAMIWRGPIVTGMIRQFYEDVQWGELDVLLIDLPPGTSDAPLTVMQSLGVEAVVIVTTPQSLASMIVRKATNLVHQLKKPVLGVIENMAYFDDPRGERHEIFGPSHAEEVAQLAQAPVLARLPLLPNVAALADAGEIESVESAEFDAAADALLERLTPVSVS